MPPVRTGVRLVPLSLDGGGPSGLEMAYGECESEWV